MRNARCRVVVGDGFDRQAGKAHPAHHFRVVGRVAWLSESSAHGLFDRCRGELFQCFQTALEFRSGLMFDMFRRFGNCMSSIASLPLTRAFSYFSKQG